MHTSIVIVVLQRRGKSVPVLCDRDSDGVRRQTYGIGIPLIQGYYLSVTTFYLRKSRERIILRFICVVGCKGDAPCNENGGRKLPGKFGLGTRV